MFLNSQKLEYSASVKTLAIASHRVASANGCSSSSKITSSRSSSESPSYCIMVAIPPSPEDDDPLLFPSTMVKTLACGAPKSPNPPTQNRSQGRETMQDRPLVYPNSRPRWGKGDREGKVLNTGRSPREVKTLTRGKKCVILYCFILVILSLI
jgi:hypothetical protein